MSIRRACQYLERALAACRELGRRREASEKISDLVYWFALVRPARALEVAREIPESHAEERSMALRWAVERLDESRHRDGPSPDLEALAERSGRIDEIPLDQRGYFAGELVEAGLVEEALQLLEARDPLDFWPQPHIDDCCLPEFRRMLRHDRARTLALIDRVTPEAAGVPLGLAAMALWSRSPKRARRYLDRIASEFDREWAYEALVAMLAPTRPEEATALMRERVKPKDDLGRHGLGLDWIRIGTDEAVREGLAILRAIRNRADRAQAVAAAAGELRGEKPRTARCLLSEAEAHVEVPRSRRGRDAVRIGLVAGLTGWPDEFAEAGLSRAERWACAAESPLARTECYEDLAITVLP